jgi:cell division transport system permease protein
MLDRIEFLLTEAITAMRRNWLMSFAAISTLAVALFLLGGLGYVLIRMNAAAEDLSGRFEMRVWLRDGVSKQQISEIAADIRAIKGVKEARWVPRDIEWKRQIDLTPEVAYFDNPFPDSFKVILSDISLGPEVESKIKALPRVDAVEYLRAEQQFMEQLMNFLQWLATFVGGLLIVTSGILIYNAIRMNILARWREVRIMELVGASRSTIRIPFILEGMLQGLLGGFTASLLIFAAQQAVAEQLKAVLMTAALPRFPIELALVVLGAAGVVFGGFCSFLAVREPVRKRMGV